jgi:hypothetical protein
MSFPIAHHHQPGRSVPRLDQVTDYFESGVAGFKFEPDALHCTQATYTSTSNDWTTLKVARVVSNGKAQVNFKIETDVTTTSNTWRFIIGCVPATFNVASNKWIGSAGGWGYADDDS